MMKPVQDFAFGFFQGSVAALITPFPEEVEPYCTAILPVISAAILAATGLDYYTPALPFMDFLIGSIAMFLMIRFIMAASRALISHKQYESETYKSIIIITSFLSGSIAGYAIFTYYDPSYCKNRIYYAWAALQLGNLFATLALPNGVISDFFCSLVYSTVFMLRTNEPSAPPQDILTVARLFFATVTALLPLVPIELPEDLEHAFLMDLKIARRPIIAVMVLGSYFIASSTAVFVPGGSVSLFHGILAPVLYILLLAYEAVTDAQI